MMLGSPSVHAQNGRQTLRFVAQADLKILDPIWTIRRPDRRGSGQFAKSALDTLYVARNRS